MQKVRQRKRDIVTSFRSGSERHITETEGVDLIHGQARFSGTRQIEVNGQTLTADLFLINVGARPSTPSIPGLDSVATLNSTSIMELDHVPDHLIVLGGGYVGLEFGQMFRRFGAQVTIVQRGPRLLGREDADIADAVATVLRQDGIEVLVETETLRAESGPKLVVRSKEGIERTIAGSHLLVATGRTSNADTLDVGATGLALDRGGFIPANDRLETSVPGIYALGDVKGGPAFTHISYDDYRVIRTNLIEGGSATIANRLVPYTVYVDPQLGRIGVTEEEARQSGRAIHVAKMDMNHVARALETDEPRGLMKVIVDATDGRILGAAVLGIEGGELMSMLQLAMLGNLPFTVLRDAVFAHPTLAEGFNNLFARTPAPTDGVAWDARAAPVYHE
jgi:pyruvate/2-oxoglutarate dehydrogenase complex dihydrolipoamide dehydrogenase (E3) component